MFAIIFEETISNYIILNNYLHTIKVKYRQSAISTLFHTVWSSVKNNSFYGIYSLLLCIFAHFLLNFTILPPHIIVSSKINKIFILIMIFLAVLIVPCYSKYQTCTKKTNVVSFILPLVTEEAAKVYTLNLITVIMKLVKQSHLS